MIKYREILRLHSQGISKRSIASSCRCSRVTINEVLDRAEAKGISWPLSDGLDDLQLQRIMFPEKFVSEERYLPDMEYIHKEMAKTGVTPYSYRQFCRAYSDFAMTNKATMRIRRKPGEILEVDWAGDPTLTTAILDRLLHRSEILIFDEKQDSIRMKYRRALFETQSAQS